MTFGIEPDSMPSARRPSNITMSAIGRRAPSAFAVIALAAIVSAAAIAARIVVVFTVVAFLSYEQSIVSSQRTIIMNPLILREYSSETLSRTEFKLFSTVSLYSGCGA